MFERYTEPARRSLFFARYEASVFGSVTIETEHLLLGVLKEREPLIALLLGTANVTADALRHMIYERVGVASSPIETSVELPFSKDSKQVLEFTAEEASRLLHGNIGVEHLLLGLLRVERGLAWNVLRDSGVALAPVREALVIHVSATLPLASAMAKMLDAVVPDSGQRPQPSGSVYELSALDGQSPGRRAASHHLGSGGLSAFSTVSVATRADTPVDDRVHKLGPIQMHGTTLPQFALVLEAFLGAPVMVESAALMSERFDIELQGEYDDKEQLIAALRDQLGLVLTEST